MLRDKDIREPLFDFLEESYGKIRILEEKNMGRSRADIVMVAPDALYGIEIKSDVDSYTRLANQVKDYDIYCDLNIVVVGTRHAMHIHEHVPEYWGIITVEQTDDGIDFYFLRRPRCNPMVKWEKKMKILWRSELAQIQEWNNMPKYKDKSKEFVIKKIVGYIPERIKEEELKAQISELLFERDYSEAVNIFSSKAIKKKSRRRRRRL